LHELFWVQLCIALEALLPLLELPISFECRFKSPDVPSDKVRVLLQLLINIDIDLRCSRTKKQILQKLGSLLIDVLAALLPEISHFVGRCSGNHQLSPSQYLQDHHSNRPEIQLR
jgi:hypothetical protein